MCCALYKNNFKAVYNGDSFKNIYTFLYYCLQIHGVGLCAGLPVYLCNMLINVSGRSRQ